MTVKMTEGAAGRIAMLLGEDGRDGAAFRIRVDGGGCMGFRYVMDIDDVVSDDDVPSSDGHARIVVDGMSLPFLQGAVIDWVEDLSGDRFEIRNPNAVSSCGCGTSFSS